MIFVALHAGHSIDGCMMSAVPAFFPFFVGLATAVISQIVIVIAQMTPTVNGG